MDIVLKNVKKKDFPVLKSLAKSLGFEIIEERRETIQSRVCKRNFGSRTKY